MIGFKIVEQLETCTGATTHHQIENGFLREVKDKLMIFN